MEKRRFRNRVDRMEKLEAINRSSAGSTDNSHLMEVFPDIKEHAKVSNAGKAANEQIFKTSDHAINYER